VEGCPCSTSQRDFLIFLEYGWFLCRHAAGVGSVKMDYGFAVGSICCDVGSDIVQEFPIVGGMSNGCFDRMCLTVCLINILYACIGGTSNGCFIGMHLVLGSIDVL
jgi:hypothetical protein